MEEKKDSIENDSQDVQPMNDGEKKPAEETSGKKKSSSHKKQLDLLHVVEENCRALELERDELKDKYLRTLAEMDNYRKRVAKEKEEFQKYALADFLLQLLGVFDNLERALKSPISANESAVENGVRITLKQFGEILKSFQVQEIDAQGKPFDPAIHEALAREERNDVSEPTVTEVYQKGFLYRDRLLRPTLAKVAIPPQETVSKPPEVPQ